MKIIITVLISNGVILLHSQYIFPQGILWDTPESRGIEETLFHGIIGSGETLLLNGTIMLLNRSYGASWAFPTAESTRNNFSSLGSFTWEALGESNHAAINDFITTVAGSLSTGEMLYRLYVEAC